MPKGLDHLLAESLIPQVASQVASAATDNSVRCQLDRQDILTNSSPLPFDAPQTRLSASSRSRVRCKSCSIRSSTLFDQVGDVGQGGVSAATRLDPRAVALGAEVNRRRLLCSDGRAVIRGVVVAQSPDSTARGVLRRKCRCGARR